MSGAEDWWLGWPAELARAEQGWSEGNAGLARVCCRRAAGMALKAWLAQRPGVDWGTNFMHHIGALADDASAPPEAREAAWRLAARPAPEAGFTVPTPTPLTPMADARVIIEWVRAGLA